MHEHKNEKIALNFFTQNALLIQENYAKIACCGKNCANSQICQNCTKYFAAQLRNFLVELYS